ncbi:MAG: hypothetical protein ACPG1C_00840 [Alphaproteobacteria bacterium]
MKYLGKFGVVIASVTILAACSTAPYRQPVTELAIASQQVHGAMESAAKRADADAKATFVHMFATNEQMRKSLKFDHRDCTEEKIKQGGSCLPSMTVPGTTLQLYPGTDYTKVLNLSQGLVIYTAWLYKIANADTCKEAGSNLAQTQAHANKLLALAGKAGTVAISDKSVGFVNQIACMAIERRKFNALKQATYDSEAAVTTAAGQLKSILATRVEIERTDLLARLIKARQILRAPSSNDQARLGAAQKIVLLSQKMDALLKWKVAVDGFADKLALGHSTLATQLQKAKPDFAAVYQAAQSMMMGSTQLSETLAPLPLALVQSATAPIIGDVTGLLREGE